MARASLPQALQSHAGVSSRGASRPSSAAGPASASRRSTAFTSGQNGVSPRREPARPRSRPRQAGGVASSRIPAGPGAQHMPDRVRRRALLQVRLQRRVQRAHPPQHRSGKPIRPAPPDHAPLRRRQRVSRRRPPADDAGPIRRSAGRMRRRGWGRSMRCGSCRTPRQRPQGTSFLPSLFSLPLRLRSIHIISVDVPGTDSDSAPGSDDSGLRR